MCGIVAAVSPAANIVPVLLEGLRKLEYRGYDSAGIADASGAPVERPVVVSQLSADAVEL
ncbi:MAG: glutamine--fructose-6-phosphate transaminase (isomerizing), partial [Thauera sp.]